MNKTISVDKLRQFVQQAKAGGRTLGDLVLPQPVRVEPAPLVAWRQPELKRIAIEDVLLEYLSELERVRELLRWREYGKEPPAEGQVVLYTRRPWDKDASRVVEHRRQHWFGDYSGSYSPRLRAELTDLWLPTLQPLPELYDR